MLGKGQEVIWRFVLSVEGGIRILGWKEFWGRVFRNVEEPTAKRDTSGRWEKRLFLDGQKAVFFVHSLKVQLRDSFAADGRRYGRVSAPITAVLTFRFQVTKWDTEQYGGTTTTVTTVGAKPSSSRQP